MGRGPDRQADDNDSLHIRNARRFRLWIRTAGRRVARSEPGPWRDDLPGQPERRTSKGLGHKKRKFANRPFQVAHPAGGLHLCFLATSAIIETNVGMVIVGCGVAGLRSPHKVGAAPLRRFHLNVDFLSRRGAAPNGADNRRESPTLRLQHGAGRVPKAILTPGS